MPSRKFIHTVRHLASRAWDRTNRPYLIAGVVILTPLVVIAIIGALLNLSSSSSLTRAKTAAVANTTKPAPTTVTPTSPTPATPGKPSSPGAVAPKPDIPTSGPQLSRSPSAVLALTNWKLTLPTKSGSSSSPDEIQQPVLDGYSNPSYFYVNSGADGVVFQAPVGGATTSGSNFARSELREMTNNGRDEAAWSTGTGVSTLTVTEAITHLPVVRPQVVAAQIHGPSSYLILIRLNGNLLFVEKDGKNIGTLNANYALGTVYSLTITADNGIVTVSYNGEPRATFSDSSSGNYFKAGCYTQSNPSSGDASDAYGQVILYRIGVSHT